MTLTREQLRRFAATHTLFPPTSLQAAVERLGFVQADPIRAPARAQDLILRHRVEGYHAGDLEARYSDLDIEEDLLHLYGFFPRKVWQLLHPRPSGTLPELHKGLIEAFQESGGLSPKELTERFGQDRGVNPWGSFSRATQLAMNDLHEWGFLRVVRREKGNRIYELAPSRVAPLPAPERLRELVLVVADLLAPLPRQTLNEVVNRVRRQLGVTEVTTNATIDGLLADGALQVAEVESLAYLWPSGVRVEEEQPTSVRFLAPFDPVVWDRRRFEHLWGWPYRFEGYTPAAKRVRGYYAMPLLWRDTIPGWANVSVTSGKLNVELGFVEARPAEPEFEVELAREIERMEAFLGLGSLTQLRDK